MNYDDILKIISGNQPEDHKVNETVKRLLAPRPLENPEELEKIISTRFRYTGPGKWVKILREAAEK